MRRLLPLAALALFMPAAASAVEIAEKQARTIPLKDGAAVVFFTMTKSSFEVVTTVAASESAPSVRFTHKLENGQSATIEMAGKVATPATRIVLTRSGDKLQVEKTPVEKAEFEKSGSGVSDL